MMPSEPPKEIYLQWYGDQLPVDCDGMPAEVSWNETKVFEHDVKYVRHTGHHPDLLMRVIRSMHSEIRGWNEVGDYPTPTDSIDKYIAEAEAEIAKERESNE